MKVKIAFDLEQTRKLSWQDEFPETVNCIQTDCNGTARMGFVAH